MARTLIAAGLAVAAGGVLIWLLMASGRQPAYGVVHRLDPTGSPPATTRLTFEGYGSRVTEPFRLRSGRATFRVTVDAGAFAAVGLRRAPDSANGDAIVPLAEGPTATVVSRDIAEPGVYTLAVAGKNSWRVDVEQ